MMKITFTAILLILAAAFSAANADDAAAAPPRPAWPVKPCFPWFRWLHPTPPIPAPRWWKPDPAMKKCLGDFPGVHMCLTQIHMSFETHKIDISPDCCKAVQQINDDCASTVFAKFQSPFFLLALKQCSAAAPA